MFNYLVNYLFSDEVENIWWGSTALTVFLFIMVVSVKQTWVWKETVKYGLCYMNTERKLRVNPLFIHTTPPHGGCHFPLIFVFSKAYFNSKTYSA